MQNIIGKDCGRKAAATPENEGMGLLFNSSKTVGGGGVSLNS